MSIKASVSSAAAGIMSLAGSLLIIFIPPLDDDAGWAAKVLLTLIGAISLYAIYAAVRATLFRWHYRRLLGTWYYASRPHDGVTHREMNFAVMSFSLQPDGDLAYAVTLYRTIEGLRKRGCELSRGRSKSLALAYDIGGCCVELAFEVEFDGQRPEDQKRKGRLSLHFIEDGVLEGDFISEVWAENVRTISSGRVLATRTVDQLAERTGTPAAPAPVVQQAPVKPRRAKAKA